MKRRAMLAGTASTLFAATREARAEGQPLSIATTASADAVPLFYAQKNGLFDRSGLDVKIQLLANGAAIAAAVASAAVDFGFSNIQTLVVARAKGIPFSIVVPGGEYNDATPTTQLLVRADALFRVAKDLEGRVVAVGALNDLQSLSVQAWLAANGADPDRVNFIESPASAALALLERKRADAIMVSEPNLHNAIVSGVARSFAKPYSTLSKRLPVSAWFGTQSWIANHIEAVKRFVDVMRHSSEYVNAHTDEMNPLIGEYTKIPVAILHDMMHARQGTVVNPKDVQIIIDAAAKYRAIDKSFPAKDMIGV